MSPDVLSVLACPVCASPLASPPPSAHLVCAQGHTFPVRGGIPRLVPEAHDRPTSASFGYEWTRYDVHDDAGNARMVRERTGFTPEDLRGRLVLEGGCGMGRHTRIAAQWGARVVALDLSEAVEPARENTRDYPAVQVVQGDLLQLPFKPASFDRIYSIGVLHHTPDPPRAFQGLVRLLKPGGEISIWVYEKWRPVREWANNFWRAITVRLPHPVLYGLCYPAVPLGWAQARLSRFPPTRWLGVGLTAALPVSHAPDWRDRLNDTFDWYSPPYQFHYAWDEVETWFRDAGLADIRRLPFPVSFRAKRP